MNNSPISASESEENEQLLTWLMGTALDLVESSYKEGVALTKQKRFHEALAAFEACLTIADQQVKLLPAHILIQILKGIAFCHIDLSNYAAAFKYYRGMESILKAGLKLTHSTYEGDSQSDTSEWRSLLPPNLQFFFHAKVSALPHLADVYDNMGLAYDNTDQVAAAMTCYHKAIEIYLQLNQKSRAANTWYYMAMGCRRREDWVTQQRAGENLLQLSQELENLNGQITAWQHLAQSQLNQNRPAKMAEYLALAVAAEKKTNHPDLARDEELLKQYLSFVKQLPDQSTQTPMASKKKWQFWKR